MWLDVAGRKRRAPGDCLGSITCKGCQGTRDDRLKKCSQALLIHIHSHRWWVVAQSTPPAAGTGYCSCPATPLGASQLLPSSPPPGCAPSSSASASAGVRAYLGGTRSPAACISLSSCSARPATCRPPQGENIGVVKTCVLVP